MAKVLASTLPFLLMIAQAAQAQVVVNQQLVENVLNSRVKLVDEFMRRFNGLKLHPSLDTSQQDYKVLNILSLFDAEMFGSIPSDSLYIQARQFAADVLENDVQLSYTDTSWIAIAKCHGKFKGKDVDFFVVLNTEKHGDICKWVINRVQGDFLALAPTDSSANYMMMPGCHETNFMELKRITTENDADILRYSRRQWQIDQTSVFFAFVNSGLLDIEYVDGLDFCFYQVPCWQFVVRKYSRFVKNSGWLISEFSRMSDQEKIVLFDTLYNQKK